MHSLWAAGAGKESGEGSGFVLKLGLGRRVEVALGPGAAGSQRSVAAVMQDSVGIPSGSGDQPSGGCSGGWASRWSVRDGSRDAPHPALLRCSAPSPRLCKERARKPLLH